MSFFEDASLVLIPSAQKTSKVYSVKPTDGSGDLTFTRTGDTATRVASNGLIERVRTNLLLQSEAFDNASWSKSALAINTAIGTNGIQANVALAPDGTTTADRVNFINQADNDLGLVQTISISPSITYTSSFYIKGEGSDIGKQVRIKLKRASGGTSVSTTNAYTLTSDWVRVPTSLTMAADNTNFQVIISSDVSGAVTCLLWGAQTEASDVMTDYIATTTAAVSVGPVANVPRLDYLNSSCPRLLLEPQRTNLVTYSENFDNAAWTKTRASVTANAATSPDGYTNADKLVEDTTASATHILQLAGITVTTTNYTATIYAKAGERSQVRIILSNYWVSGNDAIYDLSAGTVLSVGGAAVSASITDVGNGWYRCTLVSGTAIAGPNAYFQIMPAVSGSASYTGNGTSGIYIWGAQLESGAYATSYIPTLGAAVTRGADAASKTSATALIGQTEGTLFFEINDSDFDPTTGAQLFSLDNGTNTDRIEIYAAGAGASAGKIGVYVQRGTAQVAAVTAINVQGHHKVALAYKLNDYALYIDGALQHSDTSALVPACSVVRLQGRYDNLMTGKHSNKQALLFKTRLSNADLAALTA